MDNMTANLMYRDLSERVKRLRAQAQLNGVQVPTLDITGAEFVVLVKAHADTVRPYLATVATPGNPNDAAKHKIVDAYDRYLVDDDAVALWRACTPMFMFGVRCECPNIVAHIAKTEGATREH